jgi:hypothetical protein
MAKKLKPIVFHSSHQEQKSYGQQHALHLDATERLREMYRLNRKLYGEAYGKVAKVVEIHKALPGESINEFFNRVNNGITL